jgi:adenylylsulfate kinase-like enzyme
MARAGVIKGFTGVNDTYEVPTDAELTLDSGSQTIEECVATLLGYLRSAGYLTDTEPEGN